MRFFLKVCLCIWILNRLRALGEEFARGMGPL